MYYVIKNGADYMNADGMVTPHLDGALHIDPVLVSALRVGGWSNASLFAEVNAGDLNHGDGVRIVRVRETDDPRPASDPVFVDGRPVA